MLPEIDEDAANGILPDSPEGADQAPSDVLAPTEGVVEQKISLAELQVALEHPAFSDPEVHILAKLLEHAGTPIARRVMTDGHLTELQYAQGMAGLQRKLNAAAGYELLTSHGELAAKRYWLDASEVDSDQIRVRMAPRTNQKLSNIRTALSSEPGTVPKATKASLEDLLAEPGFSRKYAHILDKLLQSLGQPSYKTDFVGPELSESDYRYNMSALRIFLIQKFGYEVIATDGYKRTMCYWLDVAEVDPDQIKSNLANRSRLTASQKNSIPAVSVSTSANSSAQTLRGKPLTQKKARPSVRPATQHPELRARLQLLVEPVIDKLNQALVINNPVPVGELMEELCELELYAKLDNADKKLVLDEAKHKLRQELDKNGRRLKLQRVSELGLCLIITVPHVSDIPNTYRGNGNIFR